MALPTTGLRFRCETIDLVGYVNGNNVNSWPDTSGNGHHFANPDDPYVSPKYITNVFMNKPGLRFDHTIPSTLKATTPPLSSGVLAPLPVFTAFIVSALRQPSTGYAGPFSYCSVTDGFSFSSADSYNDTFVPLIHLKAGGSFVYAKKGTETVTYYTGATRPKTIDTIQYSATIGISSLLYRSNKVVKSLSDASSYESSYTAMGRTYRTSNCDLGAVIVYSRILSAAEIDAAEQYLTDIYFSDAPATDTPVRSKRHINRQLFSRHIV